MKTLSLFVLALSTIVFLSACKEVTLSGPVADAEVSVDLLHQPGASFQRHFSKSRGDVLQEQGISAWNNMDHNTRFLHLGKFEVDSGLVSPQALYFVTARHGKDTDADHDGRYDISLTDVEGEWHAVMSGETLLDCGARVSALTEAAYQYVRDQIGIIDDAALLARLDEFARLVVADVNGDGSVNYKDVLEFSRAYSSEAYLGDIALLDRLIAAIMLDEREHIRVAAAQSVWRNESVTPILPHNVSTTLIGGSHAGDVVLTRDHSPYAVTGTMRIEGSLIIEPGVTVLGRGYQIVVSGDLKIEGLARQLTLLEELNLLVQTWGASTGSVIRYATFENASLSFKVQNMEMADSFIKRSSLVIRNSADSGNNAALVRRNTLDDVQVTFYNRTPIRPDFQLEFSNNLFLPDAEDISSLTTNWFAPVSNLLVVNNSFHSNMRMLHEHPSAVMDVRENFWDLAPGVPLDFNIIIPGNSVENAPSIIRHFPKLSKAHPDTPVQQ